MYRIAEKSLIEWKNRKLFKPLILIGARQVGKTWLMKNLGELHFTDCIYINFEKQKEFRNLFEADLNIERIISTIALITGQKITDGETLIIFDEIQEVPNALTSLKYFNEDRPDLHVIAAGSLLGVALNRGSFPVGKVEFLKIHPMNFEEFLKATGREALWNLLEQKNYALIQSFKLRYIEALKNYFIVGGLPEVVSVHVESLAEYEKVKHIQDTIYTAYMQDFARHAPGSLIPKIISLFNGLVTQLAKENKKFIYGLIKSGARAREYEGAIDWLVNYGLVHRIYSVNKVALPLYAYQDMKNFKLYALDVGLLSFMAKLNPATVFEGSDFFQEFKGALTEQYVLQELVSAKADNISFWTNESGTAELDFIFEKNAVFYPLEVKAAENLHAKSLKVFGEKYKNIHCYRTSLSDFREEEWMTNIPLYAVKQIIK